MAGMFLLGVPLLGGVVGGTSLQVAMRYAGFDLYKRAAVEAALMVAGAASVYAYPPGAANTCKNWNWCMLSLFVAFTGAIAAVDGIVVNLSQHAPVKTCAFLLAAYLAYRLRRLCRSEA